MPFDPSPAFDAATNTGTDGSWQGVEAGVPNPTVTTTASDGYELDLVMQKVIGEIDLIAAAVNAGAGGGGGLAGVIDVTTIGVSVEKTGAENTFLFNTFAGNYAAPVDYYFPPPTPAQKAAGFHTYKTNGFLVSKPYQRILGGAGWGVHTGTAAWGTQALGGTVFEHMLNSGNCVSFIGTTTDGFNGRLLGVGMDGITIRNTGGTPGAALHIRHVSHAIFTRCWTTAFRGSASGGAPTVGGGVDASNFADSVFAYCCWEYCGGATDNNATAIRFAGDNAIWAVDQITFLKCRWEPSGERAIDIRDGSGFYCTKFNFIACKWENANTDGSGLGGTNDGNQGIFWLQNVSEVNFTNSEIAPINKRSGHALLPTIFRIKGTTNCYFNRFTVNLQGTQVFTNFVVCDSAGTLLDMVQFRVETGNAGGYPASTVLKASNSPKLAMSNCGFTPNVGSAKPASDWFTAGEWVSSTTFNYP